MRYHRPFGIPFGTRLPPPVFANRRSFDEACNLDSKNRVALDSSSRTICRGKRSAALINAEKIRIREAIDESNPCLQPHRDVQWDRRMEGVFLARGEYCRRETRRIVRFA
jgi:hypothetical protein